MDMMPTPELAGQLAEEMIVQYVRDTGCTHPVEVARVLELLISKAARAVEQTCSYDEAIKVVSRTINHITLNPNRTRQTLN